MSGPADSRFQAQNKTTQQRLSSNTVGLVTHADFRKRRAEVLEQQEREVREAAATGTPTDRSQTATPDPNASDASSKPPPKKAKKRKVGGAKLSFADGDDDGDGDASPAAAVSSGQQDGRAAAKPEHKIKANPNVSVVPRAMTKSALQREAAERDALRREFLAKQAAVKATEIALPFVFYDGSNIPGGTVRVKKGDFIWVFLDKSRKVGADLGVGDKANSRREWARIGVDDLMLVRHNIIIPHVSVLFSPSLLCLITRRRLCTTDPLLTNPTALRISFLRYEQDKGTKRPTPLPI